MTRRRGHAAGLAISPLLLAGCNANLGPVGVSIGGNAPVAQLPGATGYAALDRSVPRGVQAALPAGMRRFDVRERDLCYGYLDGSGALKPVLRPDGSQYCLK